MDIDCENCYFCTYKKPYQCLYERTSQSLPKHKFCGDFISRESGLNIHEILSLGSTDTNFEKNNEMEMIDDDKINEERRQKLKEIIKNKIKNMKSN